MQHHIASADAPFEIVWDSIGIPHVYAATVADAYRGMGYAAASERLWQIHMSTAFANGEAAALLGERYVAQDALQRAANVHGANTGLPDSDGDWIADAYLDGMNARISALDEVPPEFRQAGVEPRLFTRADIAARYRFTSWFQHKTWTEKLLLGRLMSTHGVDWFREHVLHFSAADEAQIDTLAEALRSLDPAMLALAYPEVSLSDIRPDAQSAESISGSNNWAVTGALSKSGKAMLATDPHQPHTIPNTFFYAHLHAEGWDAFGAAFPGVPYMMMGYTRDIAWGLTTGFVDCYDTYVEEIEADECRTPEGWAALQRRDEHIPVKGGEDRLITVTRTRHGPLLEPLMQQLGTTDATPGRFQTALHWSLTDMPSSAGALARLPLARTAEEFGDALFEDNVCPLVNNIICVDRHDGLRRFIATTQPVRSGVTGSVPLPGWQAEFDFPRSTAQALTVEIDPDRGFALTANNDTMGERGDFYIHNFPTHSARADRIAELLEAGRQFSVQDFQRMQLDLKDLRAAKVLPDLLQFLQTSDDPDIIDAHRLLSAWDHQASVDSAAACLFYPFQDRVWPRPFMRSVLNDNLLNAIPLGAPGLNRFDISHFSASGSPWRAHRDRMTEEIVTTMKDVYGRVVQTLGSDTSRWRWGDLHQIRFKHSLAKHDTWAHMQAGPDPIGGSPTTLGMAVHMGPGPGRTSGDEIPCMVYHGPAYRLVVDLADPEHAAFVIAGGNGGRPASPYNTNQYRQWLNGDYYTLRWRREELEVDEVWTVSGAVSSAAR